MLLLGKLVTLTVDFLKLQHAFMLMVFGPSGHVHDLQNSGQNRGFWMSEMGVAHYAKPKSQENRSFSLFRSYVAR